MKDKFGVKIEIGDRVAHTSGARGDHMKVGIVTKVLKNKIVVDDCKSRTAGYNIIILPNTKQYED